MHGNLIRSLQERAARAQPAQHTEPVGGWLLRHAPASSWWIGSVLPHAGGAAGTGLSGRVAHAEEFYAARGAVTRFQITPGACPDELDALLDSRGYLSHSPVSLQIGETGRLPPPMPGWEVIIEEHATHTCISARLGDEVVSSAKAVVDTGWTGIFGMATLPAARGKGAALAVLAALGQWSAVPHLYLQVERDNVAARSLYHRAGFTGRLQTAHTR